MVNFNGTSLVGRVAFGIDCFETFIIEHKENVEEFEILFKKLWSIGQEKKILGEKGKILRELNWAKRVIEILPSRIMKNEYFDENDFQYISEDDFYLIHNAYDSIVVKEEIASIEKIILQILKIVEIGDDSLELSNEALNNLIEICSLRSALPNIENFRNGFNDNFRDYKYSKILKNQYPFDLDYFYNISLRGMIAYGLVCIERLVYNFENNSDDWNLVFDKLWEFSCEDFDVEKWFSCAIELEPECLLEFEEYQVEDCEVIQEDEFYKIRKLYTEADESILKSLTLFREIFALEYYGNKILYKSYSVKSLEEIIEICFGKIELPNIQDFKKLTCHKKNGWGDGFNVEEYSIFVKNNK